MIASLLLAAIVSQPTTFRVDPAHAQAGFELKATMHTVHGTTTKVSGEVRAVPTGDGGLTLSGRIAIDAASLDTGNAKRDAKMHGTSLDVAANPAIVLEPESYSPAGTLTGRLTIRGVEKPVSIAATLTADGTTVVVEGTFDVTWAEFGIPDPSFFVVRIDKVVHAHFRAEFVPVP